jgi:iron complex outermembrane receptor protein
MDESRRRQAGFRTDWSRRGVNATLQGDYYDATVGTQAGRRELSGANVIGRWGAAMDGADLSVQSYLDHASRDHVGSFREVRDTVEIDAQVDMRRRDDHRFVWGGSYRASRDRTSTRPAIAFVPASRTLTAASIFAQGEWHVSEALRAQAGLRLEHNDYTGLEWLPNLRFAWTPRDGAMAWSSLSRTVRSPSRVDRDAVVPGTPPYLLAANETFESEIADVVELGYRARFLPRTTLSLTAFQHRLRGLRIVQPTAAGQVVYANGADATVKGAEGWLEARVAPDWRITGGFALMSERTTLREGRVNLDSAPYGNSPRRTYSLRSLWNATPVHEVDFTWRHVSRLPGPVVPAYSALDVRLAWQVTRQLEVAAGARNALDRRHAEIGVPQNPATFGRTWFAKLTYSSW